jgi:RES domain-containing protein
MACLSKREIIAFRIGDKRYPLFDGTGASLIGARWNSPGYRVIYGACSFAGAMLEKLAGSGRLGDIPKTHQSIKIYIPNSIEIEEVFLGDIPGWNLVDKIESRHYGDEWIKTKRTAALLVPSIIAPEEKNVVINSDHPDFQFIRASEPEDVIWDPRLFHPKQ